jgi:hypothetical protein
LFLPIALTFPALSSPSAIKELFSQRFIIKKLELMGEKYDTFNEAVVIAIGKWVDDQAAALGLPNSNGETPPPGTASGCYLEADDSLERSLAKAENELELKMVEVCDCAVMESIRADDQGEWRDDDPSYREVMEYLGVENPPNTPEERCLIHGSNSNAGGSNGEDTDQENNRVYPTPLFGAAEVSVTHLRYVELKNDLGALWRVRGGFWTLQQPFGINDSAEPVGLKGNRIRFQERMRKGNNIYLQNISNWAFDRVRFNWTPPANVADLYPVVIINLSSKRLETLPGNTNLSPGSSPPSSGTAWGSRLLDEGSYCNLAKINGWTIYFAPASVDTTLDYMLYNVHECNPSKGWQFQGFDNTTHTEWTDSNLIEHERTKTRVSFKPSGRGGSNLRGRVFTDQKKIEYEYPGDSGAPVIDSWPINTDNEAPDPIWQARLNFS